VERARQTYDRALAQLPAVDRRAQRAGLIMAAVYRTLLDEIVKDGCRVLSHRVSLPPARKFWLAVKTWIAP
jgi:phytoene synthase